MATITNNAAYEIPCLYVGTLEANIDMSVEATYQFSAVDSVAATGSGLLGPSALGVAADGGAMLGILQNAPALAEAGSVMVLGVTKALIGAGGATSGQLLMVSGGKLVAATSTNFAVAKALEVAAANTVGTVFLMSYGKQ